MVITFPVLISETVDKEILPYLLKAIERKVALDYAPILDNLVKEKLDAMGSNYSLAGNDEVPTLHLHINSDEYIPLSEGMAYGTQIIMSESDKLSSDQPYFVTIRVTTTDRVVQDFVFGFKALSLVSPYTLEIFEENLDSSRYWIYRKAKELLDDKLSYKLVRMYEKLFLDKNEDKKKVYTKKIMFADKAERVCILSANDIDKESFEYAKKDKVPLSVGNLKRSQFASLYLDDSLNKKVYYWDQDKIHFASVITYDMIYKNTLNVLPEQIDKAKQRNTSLFSKKASTSFVFSKVLKK